MGIVLDADVVIRGERGFFDLKGWFLARPSDRFLLAAITVAELWHGVERAAPNQRIKRDANLRGLIGATPVLTYTEQTAYIHARIWADLQCAGTMIGIHDIIVAATAIEHGCQVATFNKRHFSKVAGLLLIEPGA